MNPLTSQVTGEDGLLADQHQLEVTQHISTNQWGALGQLGPHLHPPPRTPVGSRSPLIPLRRPTRHRSCAFNRLLKVLQHLGERVSLTRAPTLAFTQKSIHL